MKKVMIMGLVIALVVCFAVPSMAQEAEVSPFTTTATGSVELKYSDDEAAAPSGYFQGSASAAFTGQLKATIEDKVEAVIKFKISPQALANTDLTYADAKSPYGIAVAIIGWYGDEWEDLELDEIADWNAVIEGIDLTGYFDAAGDLDATLVVSYSDSWAFEWVVWAKIWKLTDEEEQYIASVAYNRFLASEIVAETPTGTDITLADIVSDASIKLIGVGGIADITAYPLGKTVSVGSMVTSENTTQEDKQPALAFDAAGIAIAVPELTVNVVVNQAAGAAAVEDDLETVTDETAAVTEPVLGYSVGGTYALDEVSLGGKFAGLGGDNSVYSVNLAYSPTAADGFLSSVGGEYTGAGDAGAGYGLDVSISPFEDFSLGVKHLGKNTAFGAVADAAPGDQNTVAAMFSHTAGDINATFVTLGYTMDAISFSGHYALGVDTDEYGLSVNTDIASIEGLKVGGSYGHFSEIEDAAYSIDATYTIATNATLTATYGNSFDVRAVKTGYTVGLKVTI